MNMVATGGTRRVLQNMSGEKITFKVSYTMIFLAIGLASYIFSAVCASTPQEEAQALADVLKQLEYTNYTSDIPPCTWNPDIVTCDNTTGLITQLNLSSMGLRGTVSPKIAVFQSLTLLDMTTYNNSLGPPNSIDGPLPDELGELTQLQYFNFSFNPILSDFPPCLLRLTNLIDLRIDTTNMSGPIPPQISQLKNLQHLFIGNNQLKGPFPAEFGSLIQLIELTVWGNNLNDRIPDSLGNLVNLTYLNFHDCNMWGPIPASLGNLKNMNKLWLYNNLLTGVIPESFKGLINVADLNIRSNYLSGDFPTWLPTLPKLKRLDVSKNYFAGPFPNLNESQSLLSAFTGTPPVANCDLSCNYFNGSYPVNALPNINVTQNCFDNSTKDSDSCRRTLSCDKIKYYYDQGCTPCAPSQKIYDYKNCLCGPNGWSLYGNSKLPLGAIVGGVVGGVAVLLAIFALYRYKPTVFTDPFQRKKINYGAWEIPSGVQRYSFQELSKATANWSESHEIGEGGFGKVFHGTLEDGKSVAIKRASDVSLQGTLEFRNEVVLLSRLHHRHLVRLEGFCDDRGLQILVYEFMKNGNLNDLILGIKKGRPLNWHKRLEISVGVAQGLDYLHSFADPPVIHRDIKPSNILLDDEFAAKVADFGISKETPELSTHVSTRPAGTAGYLDPEYFLRRQLTTASDVYAYGICVMELVTGQQSIDHMRFEEYNLIEWVKPRFQSGGVSHIVDSSLGDDYNEEVLKVMTEVALMCSAFSKKDRPTMKEVLSILEPHLVAIPGSLSLSDKVLQLSTRDNANAKPYTGGHQKRSSSELKPGLKLDVTSSSTASTTDFDFQPPVPR